MVRDFEIVDLVELSRNQWGMFNNQSGHLDCDYIS